MEVHNRDFLKDLVSHISQIEKRYGRSIVNIRRQEEIWQEMLENEEIFLSPHILSGFPQVNIWSSNLSLSSGEGFSSVFDLAKQIADLSREGANLGIDASGFRFNRKDWRAFFTLISSAAQDVSKIAVSIHIENASILEFLQAAVENPTNINFSFVLTREFLDALREKEDYSLFSGGLHKVKKISAEKVISNISALARSGAKVYFVSAQYADDANITPHIGHMYSLSPEGPFLMFPKEAFPVIRLNILKMLKMNGLNRELDWERISDRVSHSIRMLDDMIDLDSFSSRDAFSVSKKLRRVFIGISGWADALFYLGLPYASDAAVELGAKLSSFVAREAERASWELAKERGIFPAFRGSLLEEKGLKRRNASVYSVFEDGIGPKDSLVDEEGALYPLLDEISKQRGFYDEALKKFAEENGSIANMEGLPQDIRQVFVCDRDIAHIWKFRMQSAFQPHSHNMASVHISFPDATADAISGALLQADLMGCACLSVSSQLEVRQESTPVSNSTGRESVIARSFSPRVRPEVLSGTTIRLKIACGELLVTINKDQGGEPMEVLMRLSKASPCVSSHIEALSKMASLAMASGVDVSEIVKSLKGISCPMSSFKGARKITSCADALSYVLEEMFPVSQSSSKEDVLIPKDVFKEN